MSGKGRERNGAVKGGKIRKKGREGGKGRRRREGGMGRKGEGNIMNDWREEREKKGMKSV